jgi:hypothetical protein
VSDIKISKHELD